ncbi:MAG: endolytic transglycosylase MltG, partial [Gammaproteobacteria bacterium]|nr:endolytic transglycosylase MltG [Gammaproteobacteria bacterium]
NLEGLFFPDSYHFACGTSDYHILQLAYQTLQTKLQQAWQQRDKKILLTTPYQALIIASIVEREAKLAIERPIIAGIIENRLQKKMRLQIDATVIYGLGKSYSGKLTHKNLRKATPYNTYLIAGLPPTPIALPSEASLHATLHPVYSDLLYYVAQGNGSHYFSTLLADHRAAIHKYILLKKHT